MKLTENCDIGFFCECWVPAEFDTSDYDLPGLKVNYFPRTKCKGGGLVLFYKEYLAQYISLVKVTHDSLIWIKLDKKLSIVNRDVYLCFAYIAPENSEFYNKYDCDLFECIESDIARFSNEGHIGIFGDLNSRVASVPDTIEHDQLENNLRQRLERCFIYPNEPHNKERKSDDSHLNNFGRRLISLCKQSGLRIINGRSISDQNGSITFQNRAGTSVIDYVLLHYDALSMFKDFTVLQFNTFSDHAPIETTLLCKNTNNDRARKCQCMQTEINIRTWSKENAEPLTTVLAEGRNVLEQCIESAGDINMIVSNFTETLKNMVDPFCVKRIKTRQCTCDANTTPKSRKNNGTEVDKPWFDDRCRQLHRQYVNALHNFNSNKTHANRTILANEKRNFKLYAQRTKRNFQSIEGNMLSQMKTSNPKQFYKLFRKRKQTPVKCKLKSADFKAYFESMMAESEENVDANSTDAVYDELDMPYTENEILAQVKKLKQNKAPGIDELLNEAFIAGKNCLVPVVCKLFNKILNCGEYPIAWTTGIVIPVFKKGDPNDTGNYRPITLISHLAKLFTSVLNARLLKWSEQNDIITDAQFGFKPGFGTTDAIFALHSIVAKYLNTRGRLYSCFIDYKKAFDSVDHYKLWRRMIKSGISGKLLQVIQSMYRHIRLAIKHNNAISDFYNCTTGLLQGEALSPFLFSLLINDLELDLMHNDCPTIDIEEINLFILMYADDTVLLAETADGLQSLINQLGNFADEWGLSINIAKTKVLVFRKSWQLNNEEKWFYKGTEIEILNKFCYLGIMLNYNGKFNTTQKQLAEQATKAKFILMKTIRQCKFNVKTTLELFDTYVAPILSYGSELWGANKAQEIERVHTLFMKRILGIKRSTSNAMVYNELGRMPLFYTRCNRIIKYWTKLISTQNCILKSIYKNMLHTCETNPQSKNWLCNVKDILNNLGMNDYWTKQDPGDIKIFLINIRQRLQDQFYQQNDAVLDTSPKCLIYKHFNTSRQMAQYLSKPIAEHRRIAISKLRLSAHTLAVETGRYARIDRENRLCTMCDRNEIEDEYHVTLICPKYRELRNRLIKPYFRRRPNTYKLVELLDTSHTRTLTDLARYILLVLRIRDGHAT